MPMTQTHPCLRARKDHHRSLARTSSVVVNGNRNSLSFCRIPTFGEPCLPSRMMFTMCSWWILFLSFSCSYRKRLSICLNLNAYGISSNAFSAPSDIIKEPKHVC